MPCTKKCYLAQALNLIIVSASFKLQINIRNQSLEICISCKVDFSMEEKSFAMRPMKLTIERTEAKQKRSPPCPNLSAGKWPLKEETRNIKFTSRSSQAFWRRWRRRSLLPLAIPSANLSCRHLTVPERIRPFLQYHHNMEYDQ